MSSLVLFLASSAEAHIQLGSPAERYQDGSQKSGQCGKGAQDQRSNNVTVFTPGETITVEWRETIDHPSHFRISFDEDGADFVDPAAYDDFYTDPTVLLDDIPDEADGIYQIVVTLPAVECTSCTLQVVQVMYDKPPYTVGGNDVYYQCADLELVAAAETGATGDTSLPGGPTGGSGGPVTTPPTVDTDIGPLDTADTGDTDVPVTPEEASSGCGCGTGGAVPAVAWLAPLALALRRRSR